MIETVQVMTDDLDKRTTANVETIRFSLDGTEYEMELSQLHARQLRAVFVPYIEHSRKPRTANGNGTHATGTRRGNRTPARVRQYSNAEVRQWLKSQGIEVKDRGRIAAELVDQYHAAQQ